ncbi:hypothetical protein CEB94_40425 [Streptomyces hawaiiensis]|uniref:Uncharacterized protein n=1 Tax=Streptomyces hawaiiensis TaxID=67305 RepID=A0A6G5RQL1_9ACTN|nr:hypothetical protein CEB94_40425 [Streptomyces hawaiiensis]
MALEARKASEGETAEPPLPVPSADPGDGFAATVTFLSDWKLSHLSPDDRPLPSVAHYDQLLQGRGRTAGREKEGS